MILKSILDRNLLLQKDLPRPWKKNLQTYVCSIRNVYIKKLDEIFDKYINTWLRITKMKHVYVKSGTNIDFDVGNSDKDTRFRSTVSRPCI